MELTKISRLEITEEARALLRGARCESGVLNKYRSGTRVRQEILGIDKDKNPKTFLVLDEDGDILEHYVAR